MDGNNPAPRCTHELCQPTSALLPPKYHLRLQPSVLISYISPHDEIWTGLILFRASRYLSLPTSTLSNFHPHPAHAHIFHPPGSHPSSSIHIPDARFAPPSFYHPHPRPQPFRSCGFAPLHNIAPVHTRHSRPHPSRSSASPRHFRTRSILHPHPAPLHYYHSYHFFRS